MALDFQINLKENKRRSRRCRRRKTRINHLRITTRTCKRSVKGKSLLWLKKRVKASKPNLQPWGSPRGMKSQLPGHRVLTGQAGRLGRQARLARNIMLRMTEMEGDEAGTPC